jgi:hypothetical protein
VQVTDAKLKVAINGFGRIGRNFVRCLESRGPDAPMEIVCINDSGGVKQASHLLKYAPRLPFSLAPQPPHFPHAFPVPSAPPCLHTMHSEGCSCTPDFIAPCSTRLPRLPASGHVRMSPVVGRESAWALASLAPEGVDVGVV